jgi:hypothetical protein
VCRGTTEKAVGAELGLGSSLEVMGELSEEGEVEGRRLRDTSEESSAELRNLLECMKCYGVYFEKAMPKLDLEESELKLDFLSPIKKQKMDPTQIQRLIQNETGISLATLAQRSGFAEAEVSHTVQNLIAEGLCYENKGKYYTL